MSKQSQVVGGFFQRVAAFLVDGLILGVVGSAVGWGAYEFWTALPGPTRLVGGAAATLYFGLLTARGFGGRTLGMRLTGLKVIGTDGRGLGLPVALWRALILQAPLTLNGVRLEDPGDALRLPLFTALAAVVFGLTLAQLILLFLPGRRLVHDLISGAHVVRNDADERPTARSRAAWIVTAICVVAAGAAAGTFERWFPKTFAGVDLAGLETVQRRVGKLPGVLDASVVEQTVSSFGEPGSRRLVVIARVASLKGDKQKRADEIAAEVRRAYALSPDQELVVTLQQSFDIAIAQGSTTWSTSYGPASRAGEGEAGRAPAPTAPTETAPRP